MAACPRTLLPRHDCIILLPMLASAAPLASMSEDVGRAAEQETSLLPKLFRNGLVAAARHAAGQLAGAQAPDDGERFSMAEPCAVFGLDRGILRFVIREIPVGAYVPKKGADFVDVGIRGTAQD